LLALLGTPDSDYGMTKPQIGDNVVLFLNDDTLGSFVPVAYEMGIFIINEDNTLYSLYDRELTTQFDGKSLDIIKEEISSLIKDGDFSDEYMSWFNEKAKSEFRERKQNNMKHYQNNQGQNDNSQGNQGNRGGRGDGNSQ